MRRTSVGQYLRKVALVKGQFDLFIAGSLYILGYKMQTELNVSYL